MPSLDIRQSTGPAPILTAHLDLGPGDLAELEGDRLNMVHDALWLLDLALRQEDSTLEPLFSRSVDPYRDVRMPRTDLRVARQLGSERRE